MKKMGDLSEPHTSNATDFRLYVCIYMYMRVCIHPSPPAPHTHTHTNYFLQTILQNLCVHTCKLLAHFSLALVMKDNQL